MLSHEVALDLGFREKAPYVAIVGGTMLALWLLFSSSWGERAQLHADARAPEFSAAAAPKAAVEQPRRWPFTGGSLAALPGEAWPLKAATVGVLCLDQVGSVALETAGRRYALTIRPRHSDLAERYQLRAFDEISKHQPLSEAIRRLTERAEALCK